MNPIFSKYFPPKSSNHGHVSKIKNVGMQFDCSEKIKKLFEIVDIEATLWLMAGDNGKISEFIDEKFIQELVSLGSIKSESTNDEIKIVINQINLSHCIDLITPKAESLNWLKCYINLSQYIQFRWKNSNGNISDEYSGLKLKNKYQDISRICINNGNWPHVMTDLLIPGNFKHDKCCDKITRFNEVGLIKLSDKNFKLVSLQQNNNGLPKWNYVK